MIFQNMEWLMWPPPLLRTAVRMFFGNDGAVRGQQFLDGLPARAGADSSALFRFVTYALWCLPWWISIVILSM